MKEENPIREKSYRFAIRITNLHRHLADVKHEYTVSKQVLRSGTSIGANVEEAVGAQTPKDFNAKMTIAYKEARETAYWLKVLKETNYLTEREAESILVDIEELLRILGSILRTLKLKEPPKRLRKPKPES